MSGRRCAVLGGCGPPPHPPKPVLHCKERGGRTRRHTDLPVRVFDVSVRRLDRDPEHNRDLLGLQPAREQCDGLGLAFGQPGGAFDPGDRLPGRLEHCSDCLSVEQPGATLRPQSLCGLLRREWRTVRSRLSHGVVGVGGGQEPGRWGERGGGQSAVIARAIESLVVAARDLRESRQKGRVPENSVGVVRVQPYALPLVCGQRSGLLPDADRNGQPP
jgi:hypothetical protein